MVRRWTPWVPDMLDPFGQLRACTINVMAKTFADFASENLQMFGWDLPADQIPDLETAKRVLKGISSWFNSMDAKTRRVLHDSDLSVGLWNEGFFTEWEGLYNCFAKSTVGWFADSFTDIVACLERAKHQVDEQHSDQSDVNQVVGEGESGS